LACGISGFLYPTYNLVDPKKEHSEAFALSYRRIHGNTAPGGLSAFTPNAPAWGVDYVAQGYYLAYQNVFSKDVVWTAEYQDLSIPGDNSEKYKTWSTNVQFFF
jgi:hypothetical protein